MGPVIVWTIIIFIAISAFLESYAPSIYAFSQTEPRKSGPFGAV
jgi:hypothetical protein